MPLLSVRWFKLWFYSALIFCSWGFLKDVSGLPSQWLPNDKFMHLLIFAILTLLAMRAFPGKTVLLAALLSGYGLAIELLQHCCSQRTGDVYDWLADCIGILLALAAHWMFLRSRQSATANY